MTDNDRNTRTLIVSFVIALMVMVPLRFVEYGNMLEEVRVLGESMTIEEEVASPFEAPYNEIEMAACWSQEEVEAKIEEIVGGVVAEELTAESLDDLGRQVARIEARMCQ